MTPPRSDTARHDRRRRLPIKNGFNGHANGQAALVPATPAAAGGDRNARGQFVTGNRGGPGNPFARRVAALRSALLEAITPEQIADLVKAMYARALKGDMAAASILLRYAVGAPITGENR
jgi:hypothetical protein